MTASIQSLVAFEGLALTIKVTGIFSTGTSCFVLTDGKRMNLFPCICFLDRIGEFAYIAETSLLVDMGMV
jgi:hypothetical protein